MKLLVDRLESTPRPREFEASPAWWQEQVIPGRALGCAVEGPFRFVSEVYKSGETVFLAGSFGGPSRWSAVAACSAIVTRSLNASGWCWSQQASDSHRIRRLSWPSSGTGCAWGTI